MTAQILNFATIQQSKDPDKDMENYLNTLFDKCSEGFVEIRQISSQRVVTQEWISLDDENIPAFPNNQNIYVGVATRQEGQGDKEGLLEIPAVWVDIDFKDKDKDKDEADRWIAEFSLKPSIIVNSGNGYHLYWILNTPAKIEDILKIEDINKRLVNHFCGDKGAADAARILRLPGTYNIKYDPPRLVTIERIDNDLVYDLTDFDFLPLPPSSPQPAVAGNIPSPFTKLLDGVDKGNRHTTLVSLVGHYREKGLPEEETKRILDLWNRENNPPLEEKELIDTIGYSYKHYGQNKVSARFDAGVSCSIEDCCQIIEKSAMSVKDLIERYFPPRPVIIEPWLRVGEIGMIFAKRGVGKTWLALLIGMAATRKLKIGKWETATPTGCLYIDGEMAAEDLRGRLMDLNISQFQEEAPFELVCVDDIRSTWKSSLNLVNENWRTAILDYLKLHQEFRLLIIDNLASLTPGLDENLKKEWDNINQWLLTLRSMGMAVIIVHHTGKSGDQRGTSSREDALNFSIKLHREEGCQPEDGLKFTVKFEKVRGISENKVKPFTLYLHDVNYQFTWEVVDEEPKKAELIKTLLKEGKLKQNEIAKIVDVKPSYVSEVKKQMKLEAKAKEEERSKRMKAVCGDNEEQAEDSPHTEEFEEGEEVEEVEH